MSFPCQFQSIYDLTEILFWSIFNALEFKYLSFIKSDFWKESNLIRIEKDFYDWWNLQLLKTQLHPYWYAPQYEIFFNSGLIVPIICVSWLNRRSSVGTLRFYLKTFTYILETNSSKYWRRDECNLKWNLPWVDGPARNKTNELLTILMLKFTRYTSKNHIFTW